MTWSSIRNSARQVRNGNMMSVPATLFLCVYAGLLFCIPSQLIIGPIGSPGTPANLWGLCALLWWVCATIGGHNTVRGITPMRAAIALLVVCVIVSYVTASASGWYAPGNVRQETDELWTLASPTVPEVNERMISAADRGLLSFGGWVGIMLMATEGLQSKADLERLCTWVVRFGAFVALLGVIQYFTGTNIAGLFQIPGLVPNSDFGSVDSRSILNRPSSTAVHPIEFGVVMSCLFPLALHRSLYNRVIQSWIPTLLIGLAIPLSVSRSAILATAFACLVMFTGWPNRRRAVALFLAPFAIVGLRLMAPGLVGTIRSLFTNLFNDPSVSGRTDDYAIVFQLYSENALFGRGLFTFIPRYYRILDNQILMFLLELGAVGTVSFLALVLVAFCCARGARRRSSDDRFKHLALVIAASMVGAVFSFATFDALGFPMAAGTTFLLFGLGGAAWHIAKDEAPPSETRVRKTLVQT